MSTTPVPKVMINHPENFSEYLTIGTKAKVLACSSSGSIKIGEIVEIDSVVLPSVNNSYPYVGRTLNGSILRANFKHSELQPCISIHAYAYLQKSTNEFHWFSSEKERRGYTRFTSHDIESYK